MLPRRGFLMFSSFAALSCAQPKQVRESAVAGSFYPAQPKELAAMVDGFLAKAQSAAPGEVVALVAPHAGYVYSGAVAAHGYALVRGKKYDRVVVISPSHVDAFRFAAVFDGSAYATPLGPVPVDTEFAARLAAVGSQLKLSSRGHVASGRGEHALEVQLPFLQRALGQFKLVPVVMGGQDYDLCRDLGVALAKTAAGSATLIVASSDLSHFHPYDEARKMDLQTLKAMEDFDYFCLSHNLERRIWEACGGGPVIAAMMAAERLGANQARLLKYANSGDTAGDRSSVVGYGAVAYVRASKEAEEETFSLSDADQKTLLDLARKSVESAVRDRKRYHAPPSASEALNVPRAVFVTLKKHGVLRGCIGSYAPVEPLAEAVCQSAVSAALRDSRFSPVTAKELYELEYEISVLSPLRRVPDPASIRIGRDGLLIKRGRSEGLLLPQVPIEQKWDRETFLSYACLKAGLDKAAWKDERTDIFRFTALVIHERRGASH